MSIRGGCNCNNIEIVWHTVDHSLVPRECQCDYCISKNVSYVSKAGTRVEVTIRKESLHYVHQHGTMSAKFHECGNCGELVFVTAEIDEEIYCSLNASCLNNPSGFSSPVKMELYDQTETEKRNRWRQNWCHPVLITSQCLGLLGSPSCKR
ncbi:Uncharacterised protein [Halioglobus japonicus]|nr:Uncharacterised protein [Halioglobus japonicus]